MRAVEIKERMAQETRAPSDVRKEPETFCYTMIIRTSRSIWLLSKEVRKSYINARTPALFLSVQASRFLVGACLGRPIGPG